MDKKAEDAVVWPLVTKPLSTSLAPPSLSNFLLLLSFQPFLFDPPFNLMFSYNTGIKTTNLVSKPLSSHSLSFFLLPLFILFPFSFFSLTVLL